MVDNPSMLPCEYDFIKRKRPVDANDTSLFNFCVEFGWMDHLGIVTPRGQRAIAEYESSNK